MHVHVKRLVMFGVIIAMFVVPYTYGGRLTYGIGVMDADPFTLVLIIVGSLILFSLERESLPLEDPDQQPVGRGTRFFAAMFDMYAAMCACFAVIFPIILMTEWITTGTWKWSWQTHRYVFVDILGFMLIFAAFWGIYQYFWLHLKNGRPTIGQYLMGFRIIELDGAEPRRRLHEGIIALAFWPISMFAGKRAEGVYSWDYNSNTRAVSTKDP